MRDLQDRENTHARMTSEGGRSILPATAARYDMRSDDEGWTVFDIWTGWPAMFTGAEQGGRDIEVADDRVDLLNILNERRVQLP